MNWLGELSYPVYLVHVIPLLFAGPQIFGFAQSIGSSVYVSIACFLVVVLACAIVAHNLIERPVAYLMDLVTVRRLWRPSRKRSRSAIRLPRRPTYGDAATSPAEGVGALTTLGCSP